MKYLKEILPLLATMIFAMSFSQTHPKMYQQYVAYKTSERIVVDGKANETAWKKAKWTSDFIDIEGVKIPKYKTKVKMLWDDTHYYIFAKMEEPHVWADIKKHDAVIFNNNDFEVFIDPDGDGMNYYELEINALNTVWDLFINKPYREKNIVLTEWDYAGLQSAVHIDGTLNNPNDTDQGWTLEIAIPLKDLRTRYYQKNVPKDQFWRVNFSRVNWDHQLTNGIYERKKDAKGDYLHEYNWVWSPIGVVNMHEPEQWGYVYFSSEEVGGSVDFTIPEDEKIKWELFKLYRAQKAYFEKHKTWATQLSDISKADITVDKVRLHPSLENHRLGWNIMVKSPFTKQTLVIQQNGQFSTQ